MKKLLSIAGSDCSGGAGIQADLKTFAAYKTYGMTVITSLTSQNTMGVSDVADMTPEFVGKQLDAIFDDIYPDAIKIGMVSNEGIINIIAEKLKEYKAKNIVIDPVMVSTSGSILMNAEAKNSLIKKLLPLANIITPNMKEAAVLSNMEVNNKNDMEKAAEIIAQTIDGAILITGGHLPDSADDLLYINKKIKWINGDKVKNPNTHGTGCTLSSAIAANLGKGMTLEKSFIEAKEYLTGAIKDNLNLGKGRGPLNHFYKQ